LRALILFQDQQASPTLVVVYVYRSDRAKIIATGFFSEMSENHSDAGQGFKKYLLAFVELAR